ncbi:MAG: PIG-L deacetylase family protein [Polyangiaceae bacterium]
MVISAHPDDELLGVGGTIAKHVAEGDEVHAVVVSEGATARYAETAKNELQEAGRRAAAVLGLRSLEFLGFPDQRLDTFSLLDVIQRIERELDRVKPAVVYTHFAGDLNKDHRIVCEAVMTACRPIGSDFPRRVLWFETPSSTEWTPPGLAAPFAPNVFIDISAHLEKKLEAMSCYTSELRPAPHPRSTEALRDRAAYWGQIITRRYAEAFVLAREVIGS